MRVFPLLHGAHDADTFGACQECLSTVRDRSRIIYEEASCKPLIYLLSAWKRLPKFQHLLNDWQKKQLLCPT